jgi:NTE family protein
VTAPRVAPGTGPHPGSADGPDPGAVSTLHVSFSGGEARGYAHVGTLAAIERLGLPIAEVSGSSIGAFVAALVAAGYTARQIAELGATLRRRDFLRYTWPERCLLANLVRRPADRRPPGWWSVAPYRRTVGRLLSDARFRDLRLPCTIQVTDLTHGRPCWFSPETTPDVEVALAVSASAAVPTLMTPVEWDGRLLADGGAFVRLPRIAIRADRVVTSDVSGHHDASRPIGSLTGAVTAYLHARERSTRPPRRVQGRPVTVVRYGPLVARLRAFHRPPPAVVRRIVADAERLALHVLTVSNSERSFDA